MTLPDVVNSDAAPGTRTGTALLLSGGGARAAYQVGVLQGIAALQRHHCPDIRDSPFDIIVGTSAGAINAAALACGADHFPAAVRHLAGVWSHFHVQQVYQASPWHAVGAGARWFALVLLGWLSPRWRGLQPHSLLDNVPLRTLLTAMLPLERLPGLLREGHLRALAVTTSCYGSGEHVTFYDAVEQIHDWTRARRRAVRTAIRVEHLMASSAIPILFPAARIEIDGRAAYYGDGSMRQITPIAPAIHLGARRVLVVGVSGAPEPVDAAAGANPAYPSLAQVANHALASIFLDTLTADAERLHRINHTLSLIEPARRADSSLRPIELLTITPSRRLDQMVIEHTQTLPRSVRMLMAMLGMRGGAPSARGSALATYLLFEAGFTRELMRLGRADALTRREAIRRFFGWPQSVE